MEKKIEEMDKRNNERDEILNEIVNEKILMKKVLGEKKI